MKNKNNKSGEKMQSKNLIERTVRNLVETAIVNLGYELWDIEYYNDGIEWLLEITIENPSGISISIDDCEKVTHAVNPIIDEADPIENSYSLAVSSPGLNRELKNNFHLNRYLGKEVTVKLFAKNEIIGDKTFHAALKEINETDKNFVFELLPGNAGNPDNPTVVFTKKEVAHIYAHDEIDI